MLCRNANCYVEAFEFHHSDHYVTKRVRSLLGITVLYDLTMPFGDWSLLLQTTPHSPRIFLVNCIQPPDLWFPGSTLASILKTRVTVSFLLLPFLYFRAPPRWQMVPLHSYLQIILILQDVIHPGLKLWDSLKQLHSLSPIWVSASLSVMCSILLVREPPFS